MSHTQDFKDTASLRPKARIVVLKSVLCKYPLYAVCNEDGYLYNESGVVFWNHRWQAKLVALRARLFKITTGHPAGLKLKCTATRKGFRLHISYYRFGQTTPENKSYAITMDEGRGLLFGEQGHERPYRFATEPGLPFMGAYELNHFVGSIAERVTEQA